MGSSEPYPNSLWKISFNDKLATYANTSITLQHIKSNKLLGIYYTKNPLDFNYYGYNCYKSPLTEHTEGNISK